MSSESNFFAGVEEDVALNVFCLLEDWGIFELLSTAFDTDVTSVFRDRDARALSGALKTG